MISINAFDQSELNAVLGFWQSLHPDCTWLSDREQVSEMLSEDEDIKRDDYVVRSEQDIIATVFTKVLRRRGWMPTRFLYAEVGTAALGFRWLESLLEKIREIDKGRSDTWHLINIEQEMLCILQPILESSGFFQHSRVLRSEWKGEFVRATELAQVLLERYSGGSFETDQAIVTLHECAFHQSRFAAPLCIPRLWKPWPGQQSREYVLGWNNNCLVGFAEWALVGGAAAITNVAVAPSWQGLGLAKTIAARAMQIILRDGHRSILATTQSNNTASLTTQNKLGWQVSRELAYTFVRVL